MGLTGKDQRVLIHSSVTPHPANVSLYQTITASLRYRQIENGMEMPFILTECQEQSFMFPQRVTVTQVES